MNYPDLVLFFFIYSFWGWLLEVAYSGIWEGKLINRGFLFGPLSPIYGAGAMLILFTADVIYSLGLPGPWPALASIVVLSTILVTILEYTAALILEKYFRLKLWDYSREAFNLQGRVSLKYSLFWGVLAWVFLTVIHPLVAEYLLRLSGDFKSNLSLLLLFYLFADGFFSLRKHLGKAQVG